MIDTQTVDGFLREGWELAHVAATNDLPPSGQLHFRREMIPRDGNLAVRRESLLVARKRVVLPGDRNALDSLFEGAPVVDGPNFAAYLVTWRGHDRWIPGRIHGSRLQGCDLLPYALAPGSVLWSREGTLSTVAWRDQANTLPCPASRELVAEMVRACILPHRALEAYSSDSRVSTRPTEATA